jgi:release factor glutamine methyltransferase
LNTESPATTVQGWLLHAAHIGLDTADALTLLTHGLGKNRAWLRAHETDVLERQQNSWLQDAFRRRRAGEPVAYIAGEREFYSRLFFVSPDVLIPRPETELLVDFVLANAQPNGSVLDIGTGSGCLAVSIACKRRDLKISASDVSDAAIALARKNAVRHGAVVEFAHGDLLTPWAGRRFDLLVSNLPYVAACDPHLAQGDLRFEPHDSLTDGSDGLSLIRRLVDAARSALSDHGWIALEHGFDQAVAVRALLTAAGFIGVASVADLAGHDRISVGRASAGP